MPTQPDAKAIVARNVRAIMEEMDWTQKDLQARSGVAQKTISNIVRTGSTTTGRLDAIAMAVGLPGWALMITPFPGIQHVRGLAEVAALYLACDEEGKRQIARVASAEARYTATRQS